MAKSRTEKSTTGSKTSSRSAYSPRVAVTPGADLGRAASKPKRQKKSTRGTKSMLTPKTPRNVAILPTPAEFPKMGRRSPIPTSKAYRQALVAHLYLTQAAVTQEDIAEVLRIEFNMVVPLGTIACDISELKARWRKNAELSMDARIRRELSTLDDLEGTARQLLVRGNVRDFSFVMLKVSKARRSLLGLDKAQKFQLDTPDSADNKTDEELLEIIKERSTNAEDSEVQA